MCLSLHVPTAHRVHNKVPVRMCGVHGGACMHLILYLLHDTEGVSVITALCATCTDSE